MEIILDKNSDKLQLKNYGKWNSIIGALDILLSSIS